MLLRFLFFVSKVFFFFSNNFHHFVLYFTLLIFFFFALLILFLLSLEKILILQCNFVSFHNLIILYYSLSYVFYDFFSPFVSQLLMAAA